MWVRAADVRDFEGEKPVCQVRDIDGHEILIIALPGGSHYAIDAICTHAYARLDEGEITGYEVECGLHGSRFDIRTGEATLPPARDAVRTYAVKISGDDVFVALKRNGG